MSDRNEHVRTRHTAHWSDSNVGITGKSGPKPEAEPPAETRPADTQGEE